jgi:hypothetical protein
LIERRQIFREQLLEIFVHVVQLASQGVDVNDTIIARLALLTEKRAVKLVGVLAKSLT